jgi:poly(rC)-binding protein 2/3/4
VLSFVVNLILLLTQFVFLCPEFMCVFQITGDLIAIKKALLAVSTQLRNNPPKKENEDMAAASIKLSHSVESTYMGGNMLSNSAMMGRPLSPRLPLGEKEDLTFRILCSKDKIGSIIGKGGSIVRSIRDETGAKISIDVSSDVGDERVVRVSAPEVRLTSIAHLQGYPLS